MEIAGSADVVGQRRRETSPIRIIRPRNRPEKRRGSIHRVRPERRERVLAICRELFPQLDFAIGQGEY